MVVCSLANQWCPITGQIIGILLPLIMFGTLCGIFKCSELIKQSEMPHKVPNIMSGNRIPMICPVIGHHWFASEQTTMHLYIYLRSFIYIDKYSILWKYLFHLMRGEEKFIWSSFFFAGTYSGSKGVAWIILSWQRTKNKSGLKFIFVLWTNNGIWFFCILYIIMLRHDWCPVLPWISVLFFSRFSVFLFTIRDEKLSFFRQQTWSFYKYTQTPP
jgi:hypothetical protein